MALILKDRVKETTTTTGTGTITLAGAVSGFQPFSVIGDGNTTFYTIAGGSEFEVGIGTYTLSGTTLSRNTVLSSSNSGALVSFSAGTKDVFVTSPAGANFNTAIDTQTFDSSGTWTKPSAGEYALVYIWGGGGSGGKGVSNGPAGGGGGGACTVYMYELSVLTSTVTVTIGAGGAAQTTGSTAGNAGGSTTFGSFGTAFGGGGGGFSANAGGGGGGGGVGGAGGNGSTTTAGAGGVDVDRFYSSPILIAGSNVFNIANASGFSAPSFNTVLLYQNVLTSLGVPVVTGSLAPVTYLGSFGSGGGPNFDGRFGINNLFTTTVNGEGSPLVGNGKTTGGFGGGGGGAGIDGSGVAANNKGGDSVFGGGGGGGAANSVTGGSAGTSTYGGNGSAGTINANVSAAGTQPGGGSGGTEGGDSGAGGAGRVVVYVY